MTQLAPYGKPSDTYKRRLWHRIPGMDWEEVQCQIIEPYTPPTPKLRSKELEIINAPSHFHGMSVPSYSLSLTLLFDAKPTSPPPTVSNPDTTRDKYTEFLKYLSGEHKFYDERGNIFIGIMTEPKVERKNAGRTYQVTVGMIAIKKSEYEDKFKLNFLDVLNTDWFYKDVWEMSDAGLINILDRYGVPTLYFRPIDTCRRAELTSFLNRTYKYLLEIIRQ